LKAFYEWGARQLNKRGEELCGDAFAVSRKRDSITLALADGLGSGVKASILATLTTRIAMHLLENELPLAEVVETLSRTLPVCEIRKLAYSTFAIAQFFSDGRVRVVEFDAPPCIFLHQRKQRQLPYQERIIGGKTIRESFFGVEPGDWVVFVTDGVLNAGIGGAYPLGWGWEQTARFLDSRSHPALSAQDLADSVANAVRDLYVGNPGDDVSVLVIKVRRKLSATILTGPPSDPSKDEEVARTFIERRGLHAVCGGSTAKMVARHIGAPLGVDLETMRENVPATAHIEGLDLVTEGILTLTRTLELLRAGATRATVQLQTDGAAALLRLLLSADHVHFIVGLAVNPAHQNPNLPRQLGMKLTIVREIAEELTRRGTEVTVETV